MDTSTYNVIIAGLFSLLIMVISLWAWMGNKSTRAAMDMLPPEYSGMVKAALVLVALVVKSTETTVDDQGFAAFLQTLGIEPGSVGLTVSTPKAPLDDSET